MPESTVIDPTAPTPMHRQLSELLHRQIARGKYRPGHALPSEHTLCKQYGVSRVTVRRALAQLAAESLIVKRRGSGTYVPEAPRSATATRQAVQLILPDASAALFPPPLIRGLEEACRQQGFDIILNFSRASIDVEREHLRQAVARRVAGVVLMPLFSEAQTYPNCIDYLRLVEAGIPLLFVDRFVPQLPIGYVVADDAAGTRRLVEHMLDAGRERVGYVDCAIDVTSLANRREGYREALLARHVAFHEQDVVEVVRRPGVADFDAAFEATERRLASGWQPPPALVCANTFFAIGAYRALRNAGLRVPDDVAIAGFGDPPEALVLSTPLTVWRPALEAMGRAAGEQIVQLASAGGSSEPVRMTLPGELVVRASCGAAEQPAQRA